MSERTSEKATPTRRGWRRTRFVPATVTGTRRGVAVRACRMSCRTGTGGRAGPASSSAGLRLWGRTHPQRHRRRGHGRSPGRSRRGTAPRRHRGPRRARGDTPLGVPDRRLRGRTPREPLGAKHGILVALLAFIVAVIVLSPAAYVGASFIDALAGRAAPGAGAIPTRSLSRAWAPS